MSKRGAFTGGLIALCLLMASLISCGGKVVDNPVTPTALATRLVTASASSTPLPTHTFAPSPLPDATPAPAVPSPIEGGVVEHTIRAGDTLLGLATTYDVPMAAIQLQNGMGDSTVVRIEQVLSIPPRAGWEGASRFWVIHVVKAGETLVGIARTYGLEAAELEAVNGLTNADLIVVGQELVVPLDGPTVVREPAPAPADTPNPLPTPSCPPTLSLPYTPTLPFPSPTSTTVPAVPPPTDLSTWPRETVRLINDVRAQHGLPPLVYNETLAQAAQAQANDCAQREWCSHTGSDGSDIKTRILRAGYDPASWAECWAQRQTPQGAVDIWMDEVPPNDPHRRTLLTTWLSEIGVGVAQTNWGYYFIADFGRPRQ